MKSLKVKLVSIVSAIMLALSLLIVGVWAVGSQTIKLKGSVTFEVTDKRLYIKDVRMQESMDGQPYSLKEGGEFIPGFVNTSFSMDLGTFVNSYGSFALYFDVINTMDEQTSEAIAYIVEQITAPSNASTSVYLLDVNGIETNKIPEGTVFPTEINPDTPISATIKLIITSTPSAQVDLNEIVLTLSEYEAQTYEYFTFDINEDNSTVTLTKFNEDLANGLTDIVIPEKVDCVNDVWVDGDRYTVTALAGGSTSNSGVFYNAGITSIELPSTLESIGDFTFSTCNSLQPSITDQEGVKYLGNEQNPYMVLWDGDGLTTTTYTVNSNCKFIHADSFYYNDKLTNIDLSKSANLISIGISAFIGCQFTSLDLSDCANLTSIGSSAFSGCEGLEGDLNLKACTSLTSIGDEAFWCCYNLTGLTLPNSLISIGDEAFTAIRELTGTVTIPASVMEIGINPFNGCWSLEGLVVEEENSKYYSKGSNCIIESSTDAVVSGCKNSTLPSDVKSIGERAFRQCEELTSIDFSKCTSLSSIDNSAFETCRGLKSINLRECTSLTSIGEDAFSYCTGLKSLSLPSSLISIGRSAFDSCENLTGTLNLSNCTRLTSIGVRSFSQCKITSLSLPSSLTSIESNAFRECGSLENITLAEGLTSIGDYAFSSCTTLTNITLPSSVTFIWKGVFYNCAYLNSVRFSNTSGWYITEDETATSGTGITVSNSSTNATNLKTTYRSYYWKRNV